MSDVENSEDEYNPEDEYEDRFERFEKAISMFADLFSNYCDEELLPLGEFLTYQGIHEFLNNLIDN